MVDYMTSISLVLNLNVGSTLKYGLWDWQRNLTEVLTSGAGCVKDGS